MAGKTVNELAHALSDSERKELVERIQRSLSLGRKDQAPIYHSQVSTEYREQMVKQGLAELGLLQRVLLWIRRLFTGKSNADLYVELKIAEMGRVLESSKRAEIHTRFLLPAFAERIYRLYLMVVPLQPFFSHLWGSEKNMRDAAQFVLTRNIPKARAHLYDFINEMELEDMYESSESKQALRQELLNRLASYLETIPADVFSTIEEGLLPLYYLKEICAFDFPGLIGAFQVDLRSIGTSQPEFKPASVDRLLDELEHLYYALHTAKKGDNGEHLHAELYQHFRSYQRDTGPRKEDLTDPAGISTEEGFGSFFMTPPPQEETPSQGPADDLTRKQMEEIVLNAAEEGLRTLKRQIRDLRKEIDTCLENTGLADLIRFFRDDPYYKFIAYVPSLNLRDFYYASTRMKLMEELETDFSVLRKRIIARLVQEVFQGNKKDFENFRKQPLGFARGGLPVFRYVESLNILFNYVSTIFVGYVRDMLKLLVKVLPGRNRDNTGELTFHLNGLEGLYEKILSIDIAFAPDNEDGKTLSRIRLNMEKDLNQERMFRIFVAQKDKDMRPIIEEGLEHLRSLSMTLDDVLQLPPDMINERFTAVSGMTVSGGFHARFTKIAKDMKQILRAARYQRLIEEEQT